MYYVGMTKTKRSIIAERIEDLLRIKNMSVADLSRISNVSESAISNILSGARKQPRSDTIQKLANAFPTSTDYLNGKTTNHEPTDAPKLPPYAAEVLESMRKSDPIRNFALYLVAKGFSEEGVQFRSLIRQEMINMLLDYGDDVAGPEETNRVMEFLQKLDQKIYGDNIPPRLSTTQPSDPSE